MAQVHFRYVTCEKKHDKVFRGPDEMRLLISTDRQGRVADIRRSMKKGESEQLGRSYEFDHEFSVEVRERDPKKENRIDKYTFSTHELFPMPKERTRKTITLDGGRARYSVSVDIHVKDQELGKH